MPPLTERLAALAPDYDLVVIGGGITGAGVFSQAVRGGARALLVEAGDFASGTSSASSKLVHGGLRYLKTGQWRLTREAVRERQRLLDEAPALVEPQTFLLPIYRDRPPQRWLMQLGLRVYDAMAGVRRSGWLDAAAVQALEPALPLRGLVGALRYEDAQTDDARLVLRLILEATAAGASALNYVRARVLPAAAAGREVELRDEAAGVLRRVRAGIVVNATGAWAEALNGAPPPLKLRPLRGSHLLFSAQRLPLRHAVSWLHPRDGRPVFAYPWQGAILCGTTDLDHDGPLAAPTPSAAEIDYLLAALARQFPAQALGTADILSVYAGVRPVVQGGRADPSAESREHLLWAAPGCVGIAGGKLTTFRTTARAVLREAARQHPRCAPAEDAGAFEPPAGAANRLQGRLGAAAAGRLLREHAAEAAEPIAGTPYCWAELRWALRHEQVLHLDDLLLRRTRLGLLLERGGEPLLPRVLALCGEELGWDAGRCSAEAEAYRALWQRQHAPPGISG